MELKSYVARVPYRHDCIPYACRKPTGVTLGMPVALPVRSFSADEAPAALRFSVSTAAERTEPVEFRIVDGRFYMQMQVCRTVDGEARLRLATEDDLPTLFGHGLTSAIDDPIARSGLACRNDGRLELLADRKAADAARGERGRWGKEDSDEARAHAHRMADAIVLIDGVVHHRTAEPVWVVTENKVDPVLGRGVVPGSWWAKDVAHAGFPGIGGEHRNEFCRHVESDSSAKKQFFQADRLDDALAFASAFGEPVVGGDIEIVGAAPYRLPAFAEYVSKLVLRLERDISGDDFRRFDRDEFQVYADLREALAVVKQGDRSALDTVFAAMRSLSESFGLDGVKTLGTPSNGRWVVPFKALVRRWDCETARPDFDLYPEDARPDVPSLDHPPSIPGLAA